LPSAIAKHTNSPQQTWR